MGGGVGERIQALLEVGEGNPVVEEFGDILCARWLDESSSTMGREAADEHLVAALEALLEWGTRKGLLAERIAEVAAHASA